MMLRLEISQILWAGCQHGGVPQNCSSSCTSAPIRGLEAPPWGLSACHGSGQAEVDFHHFFGPLCSTSPEPQTGRLLSDLERSCEMAARDRKTW